LTAIGACLNKDGNESRNPSNDRNAQKLSEKLSVAILTSSITVISYFLSYQINLMVYQKVGHARLKKIKIPTYTIPLNARPPRGARCRRRIGSSERNPIPHRYGPRFQVDGVDIHTPHRPSQPWRANDENQLHCRASCIREGSV
jgi:hypothetical protein